MRGAVVVGLVVLAACRVGERQVSRPEPPVAVPSPRPELEFVATAYSVEGKTATGTRARAGVVAADPDVLPLGTRIRVHDQDGFSGEYEVEDTGRKISGRQIDIYVANDAEAKRFGKRRVRVEVLRRGAR
jgi:3D (Asp-Asp-Asp) domain-containing protein